MTGKDKDKDGPNTLNEDWGARALSRDRQQAIIKSVMVATKEATDTAQVEFEAILKEETTPAAPIASCTSSGAIGLTAMKQFDWT